jgi:hypothetical protein
MDSWNPFSSYFWTYANLFSQSDLEAVTLAKDNYLKRLNTAFLKNPNRSAIAEMFCPRSRKPLIEAVISPTGHVFHKSEKEKLGKEIKYIVVAKPKRLLYKNDLYDFPELAEEIKSIQEIKRKNSKTKALYLSQAVTALATRSARWLSNPPEVFICPISQKIIEVPVLTPEGQLCDRGAILQKYSEENTPEKINKLLPFHEFEKPLKEYKTLLVIIRAQVHEVGRGIGRATKETGNTIGTLASWLFLGGNKAPEKPVESKRPSNNEGSAFEHGPKARRSWLCGL